MASTQGAATPFGRARMKTSMAEVEVRRRMSSWERLE